MATTTEKNWGGANKIYTTKRDAYNKIVDAENSNKFSRQIDAFHAAAAVGIRLRTPSSVEYSENREELANMYSIDPDGILWAVISSLHHEASGDERFKKLMYYADYGAEKLAEEFDVYGNIQSAIDAILKKKP
jgi:plasmid maintenance system killer protein